MIDENTYSEEEQLRFSLKSWGKFEKIEELLNFNSSLTILSVYLSIRTMGHKKHSYSVTLWVISHGNYTIHHINILNKNLSHQFFMDIKSALSYI